MIYRHSIEDIKNYFREDALNQSALKVIVDEGMQSYLDQQYFLRQQEDFGEKKHLVIGGAVDCKLTHPEGSFEENYFKSTLVKKPGKGALATIRNAYSKVASKFTPTQILELHYYKEEVYEACNEEQYYANRDKGNHELDTRIASLIKDNGQAYWEELIKAEGKQVLIDEELVLIDAIKDSFLSHTHTAWIFQEQDQVDTVYQLPLFFKVKDTYCKAMLDVIRIEHDRKLIRIIDIKTIGDFVTKFNDQSRRLRYDIQASFYYNAVKSCLKQLSNLIGRGLIDYKIAFAFAVESTVKPGVPLVFPVTDKFITQGEQGDGKYLLGWQQGINTFEIWAANAFELEAMVSERRGVVWLDGGFNYDQIF